MTCECRTRGSIADAFGILRTATELDGGLVRRYLFQLDEVKGASHFKVRLEKGIEIMRGLRRRVSGLAIPHYALDISGGLGKVPLDHQYLGGRVGDSVEVESPLGGMGMYRDDGLKSCCAGCGVCGPEGPGKTET